MVTKQVSPVIVWVSWTEPSDTDDTDLDRVWDRYRDSWRRVPGLLGQSHSRRLNRGLWKPREKRKQSQRSTSRKHWAGNPIMWHIWRKQFKIDDNHIPSVPRMGGGVVNLISTFRKPQRVWKWNKTSSNIKHCRDSSCRPQVHCQWGGQWQGASNLSLESGMPITFWAKSLWYLEDKIQIFLWDKFQKYQLYWNLPFFFIILSP